jgi:hypothetical protein
MAFPFQQPAWTLGEISPGLFGRQDLARNKVGAATMRNMWPKYSGGAYSRGGTAFVGFSKQTGRTLPPRLIPFQFSISQGLELEFGNFYMRVIANGAYVTEPSLPIANITNGNPAIVTMLINGVSAATPNNGGVTASYAPGDQLTLAGGSFSAPAILAVTNTKILSLALFNAGNGVYAPGDTLHLTGGVQSTAAILTVITTQVVAATIHAAGTGGTNGLATVTGTTGTGTKFQASVTIAGGIITAVNSITVAGSYTVNPTTPSAEPVTGGGLTGAQLNVQLGVLTFAITNAGVFTTNPASFTFTQASTSGSGLGASFSNAIMGVNAVSVANAGSYTVDPTNPVSVSSSTGSGVGVTFNVTIITSTAPYSNGDWIEITLVLGETEVNNQVFVVENVSGATFTLNDVYGNAIDATAFGTYLGGGQAARIYTTASPYAEADLAWLKFTQSADVMSICCLNQDTLSIYPPYDLTRHSDTSWTFHAVIPGPTIGPPGIVGIGFTGNGNTAYGYQVTVVNPADLSESLPAGATSGPGLVDIETTPGTITFVWTTLPGVLTYNVYKTQPLQFTGIPAGQPYGFVASIVNGNAFYDSGGIVPDYTTTPPQFTNPWPTVNDYPSTVAYAQERRVYANSINQPDQYVMSQPGSFTNFDVSVPTLDSDAITGAPWSVQVDGIQFMVDMPGGLVVLTGREAWQLTGTGGSSLNPQPITPSNQQAQPQAFNGCSNLVPPIKIDYDILYVQAKGAIVRDLAYQFYQNIYTGSDLTLNSAHLFQTYQIEQWAWTEEPYKILWAQRNDGILLSLTYVKPEQIAAWARHDTNGLVVSVSSITEPPVDALYLAVQREIGTNTAYMIERMDNRLWNTIDEAWCVDCGLALVQPTPDGVLTISSATGSGTPTAVTVVAGGQGYSSGTQMSLVDNNGEGPGTGAVLTPTIVGGVITGVSIAGGAGYVSPQIVTFDPAGSEGGSGFEGIVTLLNTVTLTSNPGFFLNAIGDVVRAAGGSAVITGAPSPTEAIANILQPFVLTVPNTNGEIMPIPAGDWTLTTPTSTIEGLIHLRGATVTGVADGIVIPPQVVTPQGEITLATPASNVVVGLGFTAQLQSLYLEAGQSPTGQGQRKKIPAVTARMEQSRSFMMGANQPDGSTLSPPQIAPAWTNLAPVPDKASPSFGSTVVPLWTGDVRIIMPGGYDTKGQVALQQSNPLPMNCLSIIPEDWPGDEPQLKEPPPGKQGNMPAQ